MNTRRQTVWLVSMLGLMVVLSAYYLFTDEVKPTTETQEVALNEIELEGLETLDQTTADAESTIIEGEELSIDEVALEGTETDEAGVTDETAAAEETEIADEAAASTEEELTDEEILQQLAAEKDGQEAIAAMQMERTEQFAEEMEQLTATITNSEATNEEVSQATQRQDELFELDARLIAFEEKLMVNNYMNAVVTFDETTNHYTVNVNAASLEKSEAGSIIKMAIEDLKISMHQISVKLYK